MKKNTIIFVVLALIGLNACNTMSGAGEDISNGGKDLTHAADRNK